MDWLMREEILIGNNAVTILKNSTVAIIGLGGVGGGACEGIARAGVGKIIICDFDIIDKTNINRQIIANHENIGDNKTLAWEKRIKSINPNCEIKVLNFKLTKENLNILMNLKPDFIIDCIDMVTSKLDLIEEAYRKNINIISSMGTSNKLHPEKFTITDISKTKVCPLAKVIRIELRKRNIHKGIPVIYSEEEPKKPESTIDFNEKRIKTVNGSISFVPPVAGLMLAGYVIRKLINAE